MKNEKAYAPATANVVNFGKDDIVRTSDLPGIVLPDIDLSQVTNITGIKALGGINAIEPETPEE